jgi:hypothetical protein
MHRLGFGRKVRNIEHRAHLVCLRRNVEWLLQGTQPRPDLGSEALILIRARDSERYGNDENRPDGKGGNSEGRLARVARPSTSLIT